MIKFVAHKKIDKQKWDACIDQSFNQSASAYSWYLDTIFENWSALILDDYQAVFPLAIKSKFSIHYFLQPLFIRCIGIYSKPPLTENVVNDFFDAIPANIKLIDFHLKENIPFKRTEYTYTERMVQILELNRPYEEISKSYHKSAHKNLRKAAKKELFIVDGISAEQVAESYQQNIGAQVERLTLSHFKAIENIMSTALINEKAFTIGVKNMEGVLLAAAFFMFTKNTIYFSFGSANTAGKAAGAMYLMTDEIIKRFAGKFEKLDFEGSDVQGIATFNRNFGAKDCVYLQVKKNTLPGIVKWISGK